MSGSPKYTDVVFEAHRQAQLEAARQARAVALEMQRRQFEEAERQRRLAELTRAVTDRSAALTARVDDLRRRSAALSQRADVARLADTVAAQAGSITTATDEDALRRLDAALRDAERQAGRLTADIARELTQREHAAAVDVVLGPLATADGRDVYDPEGSRTVKRLTGEARRHVGDATRFPPAHRELSNAVTTHLDLVDRRQAEARRLAGETDAATIALRAALADAAEAGVEVPDHADLTTAVTQLGAERDGRNIARWQHRVDGLRRSTEELTARVDAHLDRLDRMAIIVEAATAALPKAGLRVVPHSLDHRADAVSLRAERADGSGIELTVHAGDGRGSRLEYLADGTDTVVETTPDGEVRRCDLTEQLLERFHDELGRQGVRADGLHWHGKPEGPRSPNTAQAARPATADRTRS
jgi:hypothetical protein